MLIAQHDHQTLLGSLLTGPILNYFGFRAAKLACARSWSLLPQPIVVAGAVSESSVSLQLEKMQRDFARMKVECRTYPSSAW